MYSWHSGVHRVPVLGEFKESDGGWARVFEKLQAAAPAALSIVMRAVSEDGLQGDRAVGNHLSNFVGLVSHQLETAGFSQLGSARRSCDRYLMNVAHLGDMRIRVAAADPRHCVSVSHAVVSRLGGMRAFEIRYPTRYFSDLSNLITADLDFPVGTQEGWKKPIERLAARLQREAVKQIDNESVLKYLVRMPHLYTEMELDELLCMPTATDQGLPGIRTMLLPPFYPSSISHQPVLRQGVPCTPPEERVRIGRAALNPMNVDSDGDDNGFHWHTVSKQDLSKHALIVGSTGSGKTVTTFFLVRELNRLKVPILIVEPVKTEYFDQLRKSLGEKSIRRWRFEASGSKGIWDPDFIYFDPMRLQTGVSVARHVSYLKSCFEAAFPLEPWMGLFLENALVAYYTDGTENGGCGFGLFRQGGKSAHAVRAYAHGAKKGQEGAVYPAFSTFCLYVLEYFLPKEFPASKNPSSSDWVEQTRQLFRRRFTNLRESPLGRAFEKADAAYRKDQNLFNPISRLLKGNSVVELDGVPDGDQKALIMAFLLTFIVEARQAEDQRRRQTGQESPGLQHFLIVEEAHRLLSNGAGSGRGKDVVGQDSRAKAVSMFADMLAEIRAYGQGIGIVEQIPTKIIPEAVKNTNLKIMLRMTSQDDRDFLGAAMNFSEEQKRFVTGLRAEPGKAVNFVVFDESLDQPVLLTLPLDRADKKNLFDQYFV